MVAAVSHEDETVMKHVLDIKFILYACSIIRMQRRAKLDSVNSGVRQTFDA